MFSHNSHIHPSSIVDSTNIGKDSKIWAFVHILKGAKIGSNANICDHCYIENEVVIGDNVTVKCGVWLWDGIVIENNVFIGPGVAFTNDLYPRSKNTNYDQKKTLLREGCSIGANSTILAGVTIGRYAMIGAGSVVTKDVSDFELVYGNPAHHQGYVCKCGKKISLNNNICSCDCGCTFELSNGRLKLV
jgi:acetyltransferase-like isoleucine patch superfamily enzyme